LQKVKTENPVSESNLVFNIPLGILWPSVDLSCRIH